MGEMRGRSVVLLVLSLGLVSAPAATAIGEQVPPSLVFVRDGNVFRTTLDGYETFGLTISASVERSPAVSPDRTRIAFARGRDELWLMNVDGTGARKVLGARPSGVRNASTGSPSWSPRGETIFVPRASRTTGVCSSIFQVGANGRGLRRVTQGVVRGSHESDPAASPNGRLIALSADECGRASRGELEVVTALGRPTKNLAKLGTTPGAQVAPAWSPDGERLAFEVRDARRAKERPLRGQPGRVEPAAVDATGRSEREAPTGRPTARRSPSRPRAGSTSSAPTAPASRGSRARRRATRALPGCRARSLTPRGSRRRRARRCEARAAGGEGSPRRRVAPLRPRARGKATRARPQQDRLRSRAGLPDRRESCAGSLGRRRR